MRLVLAACVLACSLSPALCWAQEADDTQSAPVAAVQPVVDAPASQHGPTVRTETTGGFLWSFKQLPRDFVRFGSIDTLKTLAVGAAAATTAHRWDASAGATAQRHLTPSLFSAGNVGGNFFVQTGTAVGVLSIATLAGSTPLQSLGSDLLRSQILTQGVVQAGKIVTRRARPDGSNHHSLPSGHTAASFATASVLQRHFGWAVGAPAYAFGAYVAAARMSANRHHLSDVLMGASVGIAAGHSVTVDLGKTRLAMGVAPTTGGAVVTFTQQ